MNSVLTWEKPPREKPAQEHAACYGGGIPGAYAPNMTAEWKLKWKARLCGQKSGDLRVEIRKTLIGREARLYAQVLIVVCPDGTVRLSMNGPALFTRDCWDELAEAVAEARGALGAHLRDHPQRHVVGHCPACGGDILDSGYDDDPDKWKHAPMTSRQRKAHE